MATIMPPSRPAQGDPVNLLRYLLAAYDVMLQVHSQVNMDTDEDRSLHARAVTTFMDAAEPVRKYLWRVDA